MRRLTILSLALGLGLTAAVFTVQALGLSGVRAVEAALFDQYQKLSPRPYDPDSPVRIVTIDDASLKRFGQWPWPRTYMAELTRRLTGAGVAAIGYDIVFAERDRTTPEVIEETWRRFGGPAPTISMNGAPDHDAAFAARLGEVLSVLAIAGRGLTTDETGDAPPAPVLKAGISVVGDDPAGALERQPAAVVNLPVLAEAAWGIGVISLGEETGRIVREVPLVKMIGGRRAPALSVELLRVALREGGYTLKTTGAQGELGAESVQATFFRVGDREIPVTGSGAMRVYFAGSQWCRRPGETGGHACPIPGQSERRTIPAWRILAGDAIPAEVAAEVANRIVLVGVSAEGLLDIIATPLERRVPGTAVHAEMIEQIAAFPPTYLIRPDWAFGLERLGVIVFGLVATGLGLAQRPWIGLAAVAVLMAGAFGASWLAFDHHKLLVGPIFPALTALAVYVVLTGVGIFTKERERRAIRSQFAHFVPAGLIEEIAADPERQLTPQGAERVLSVMFIDVRGFSSATEHMDPQTVVAFVNDFLTPLSDLILDRGGTIDKFIGDAVMAFWNAPGLADDHAARAVRTLLDLPDVIERINRSNRARGLPAIRAGAGVNTGPCSVGLMGSRRRLGYTTIGDAVNLASRLEGLTKAYGVTNCIGETTAVEAGPGFAILEIDRVAVKGRARPERVHTVVGGAEIAEDPGFAALADRLAAARAAYAARDWDRAQTAFQALGNRRIGLIDPQGLAAAYLARIAAYRERPPPADWDGTHMADSK